MTSASHGFIIFDILRAIRPAVTLVTRFEPSSLNVIRRASYDQDSVAGGIVHRHLDLVMFNSLFLFLWTAISNRLLQQTGRGKLRLDRSSQQISQFVWPKK